MTTVFSSDASENMRCRHLSKLKFVYLATLHKLRRFYTRSLLQLVWLMQLITAPFIPPRPQPVLEVLHIFPYSFLSPSKSVNIHVLRFLFKKRANLKFETPAEMCVRIFFFTWVVYMNACFYV